MVHPRIFSHMKEFFLNASRTPPPLQVILLHPEFCTRKSELSRIQVLFCRFSANNPVARFHYSPWFLKGVLYCFRDKLLFKRNQSIALHLCINRPHPTLQGKTESLLQYPRRVTVDHQWKHNIHSVKKCRALCLHFTDVQGHDCGVVPQGRQTRDN